MMNATHALGWALVHFLWQGAALAFLLGVALALIRPTAARTRYTVSIVTLAAMLVIPIATTLRLYEPVSASSQRLIAPEPSSDMNVSPALSSTSPAPSAPSAVMKPLPRAEPRFTQLRDRLEPVLPWLVVVWVLGGLILSVRLAYGWMAARRLQTDGTRDVSASLQHVLARLAARLRVNRRGGVPGTILAQGPPPPRLLPPR